MTSISNGESLASVRTKLNFSLAIAGTPLTFTTSASIFGRTLFASVETFTIPSGNRLEVEALLWMAGAPNANGLWIGDGTKAVYNVREAAGTDYTLGRYSAGDSSLGRTLAAASAMAGLNRMGLTAVPFATGTQAVGSVEGANLTGAGTPAWGSTANLVNTAPVRVYVAADDITKCIIRARHLAP